MSSSGKLRSASTRLHAALAALPSAGFAAALAFGASGLFAQTNIVTGGNLFSANASLGVITRESGGTALFSSSATISAAGTSLANGIIGPWAIIGSGSDTRYATLSSDAVVPYSGATQNTNWGSTMNSATTNYDVAAASATTFGASTRTANTVRFLGAADTLTLGNSGSGAQLVTNGLINAGSGTLNLATTSAVVGAGLAAGSGQELVLVAANAAINISARVHNAASGASAITILGPNTVTLSSNANDYTGTTYVNSGTLLLSGNGSINTSAGISVNGSTAKYVHTSTTASTRTITLARGTVDGTGTLGTVNVADNSAAILANGNGGTGALTLGALNFAGDATLNLRYVSGTRPLNVTGSLVTTPANGVVTVNASATGWTTGTHNLVGFGGFSGSASDFALGTVSGLNSRQTVGSLGLTSSNLTLQINGDSPRWTGAQSSAWTTDAVGGARNWRLVTAGTATEFIAGDEVLFDDTATGSTVIDISTANVAPASTTFNNSTKNYTVSSSGGFGIASGSLAKNGTGTVVLATANTYTGSTTINAGVLQLGDGSTDGSIANSAAIANNGTLAYNLVGNHTYANAITGAGAVNKTGAGVLTLSGANTYTGGTTINGGSLSTALNLGGAGTNVVVNSAGTLALAQAGTISNVVSGPGTVTSTGATLTGDWSGFSGSFTHNSSTVSTSFNNPSATSKNAAYTIASVQGGSQGLIAGYDTGSTTTAYTLELGSLSGIANSLLRGGNSAKGVATLKIGNLGTNTTFAGVIANGGNTTVAVSKVGAGALVLSGNNTYTGGTIVNAGALIVDGALSTAANAVTVASGGTLGGNGTIAGAITVDGTLAPGDTVGVLTASGALTLNSGSTTRLEINGLVRGTEHDGVNTGGAFTQGGTLQLAFGSAIAAGNYTLFQINGTSSGAFSSVTAASSATPTPVSLTNSAGVWTGTIDGSSLSFNPTTGVLTTTAGAAHTALQTWRFDQFGVYDDTGAVLAGDTEDYDGDGLANLLEYALGSDPKVAGASPITVARSGNVLTLTYTRRSPADAGLTYTVQGSADLSSGFSNATGSTNTVGATSTYTDNVDLSAAGVRRFLRLSVSYTAP